MKELLGEAYDPSRDLWGEVLMNKIFKIDDWYNDKTAMLCTIRKGKGRKPYLDSTIYFNLRVQVDGKEMFSNFPKALSETTSWEAESSYLEKFCDFKEMTVEEREASIEDSTAHANFKVDSYQLPSFITKMLKNMQKN